MTLKMSQKSTMRSSDATVRCCKCLADAGIYKELGDGYVFQCTNCGVEISSKQEITAKGVVEIRHGDGSIDIAVLRGEYNEESLIKVVKSNAIGIKSAVLRKVADDGTMGIIEKVIIKERCIRTIVASIICRYNWLKRIVGQYYEWRDNAKEKGNTKGAAKGALNR